MNTPNTVKRDIRAFERWLNEAPMGEWPLDLLQKGQRALLALKTLDQPNVPDIITREAAKDMADFLAAHAAHVASKGA